MAAEEEREENGSCGQENQAPQQRTGTEKNSVWAIGDVLKGKKGDSGTPTTNDVVGGKESIRPKAKK